MLKEMKILLQSLSASSERPHYQFPAVCRVDRLLSPLRWAKRRRRPSPRRKLRRVPRRPSRSSGRRRRSRRAGRAPRRRAASRARASRPSWFVSRREDSSAVQKKSLRSTSKSTKSATEKKAKPAPARVQPPTMAVPKAKPPPKKEAAKRPASKESSQKKAAREAGGKAEEIDGEEGRPEGSSAGHRRRSLRPPRPGLVGVRAEGLPSPYVEVPRRVPRGHAFAEDPALPASHRVGLLLGEKRGAGRRWSCRRPSPASTPSRSPASPRPAAPPRRPSSPRSLAP